MYKQLKKDQISKINYQYIKVLLKANAIFSVFCSNVLNCLQMLVFVILYSFIISGCPDPPTNVTLNISSSTSLLVKFGEPLNRNGAVVTKYKGAFYVSLNIVFSTFMISENMIDGRLFVKMFILLVIVELQSKMRAMKILICTFLLAKYICFSFVVKYITYLKFNLVTFIISFCILAQKKQNKKRLDFSF